MKKNGNQDYKFNSRYGVRDAASATGGENAGLGGGGDQVRTGDTSRTKLRETSESSVGGGRAGEWRQLLLGFLGCA